METVTPNAGYDTLTIDAVRASSNTVNNLPFHEHINENVPSTRCECSDEILSIHMFAFMIITKEVLVRTECWHEQDCSQSAIWVKIGIRVGGGGVFVGKTGYSPFLCANRLNHLQKRCYYCKVCSL